MLRDEHLFLYRDIKYPREPMLFEFIETPI